MTDTGLQEVQYKLASCTKQTILGVNFKALRSICQIQFVCYCNPIGLDLTQYTLNTARNLLLLSVGESNTVVSAYMMYRHLQQYCSHPSI